MTEKENMHAHCHNHGNKPQSKYEEALGKYNTEISDDEVREAVKKIIAEKVHENDNIETKKFLMGSIELTTLKTTGLEDHFHGIFAAHLFQFAYLVGNALIVAAEELAYGHNDVYLRCTVFYCQCRLRNLYLYECL